MIDRTATAAAAAADARRAEDAGTAVHHWLIAIVLGMLFGAIGLLVDWVVLRALN